MRPSLPLIPALLASAAACTPLPDLPGPETADRGPFPALVPLEQVLGPADRPLRLTAPEAARLQARGAALGGPVPGAVADSTARRLALLRARAAVLRRPATSESQKEAIRRALAALPR